MRASDFLREFYDDRKGDDGEGISKIVSTADRLLKQGYKVDLAVVGAMGRVYRADFDQTGFTPNGALAFKRKTRHFIRPFLIDDDEKYDFEMVAPRHYKIVDSLTRSNNVNETEEIEHFNGIEIHFEDSGDGEITVQAMAGEKELGYVLFLQDGPYLVPKNLEVDERFRGQGIASTMYDFVKSKGYRIRRSSDQTDAGAGFWDKHRPGKQLWESNISESTFADHEEQLRDFVQWCVEKLKIKQALPKIRFQDTKEGPDQHRTGYYDDNDDVMWIYTGNRNLIDIMRTVAHELAHRKQHEADMVNGDQSYPGSPIEQQADAVAGYLMKLYGREHPEIIE